MLNFRICNIFIDKNRYLSQKWQAKVLFSQNAQNKSEEKNKKLRLNISGCY